jgi:hypothetical protein
MRLPGLKPGASLPTQFRRSASVRYVSQGYQYQLSPGAAFRCVPGARDSNTDAAVAQRVGTFRERGIAISTRLWRGVSVGSGSAGHQCQLGLGVPP